VKIRRATPDDAGAIAAIHVASSLAAYRGLLPDESLRAFTIERREKTWREILDAGEAEVWIASEDGRDVGWICVGKSRDPDAEPTTAEVWAIYIDPGSWRRGVGRALWAHAEAQLRSASFTRVTLWVLRDNARALGFYRDLGFVEDVGHAISRERGGAQLVDIRLQCPIQSKLARP
jgi:ribosomal protein S18 acetylase RimI-like enzyme